MTLSAMVGVIYPPIIVVVNGVRDGYWLGLRPVPALLLYGLAFLCLCGWGALIVVPVRARRATVKVARAARAARAASAAVAMRRLERGTETEPPTSGANSFSEGPACSLRVCEQRGLLAAPALQRLSTSPLRRWLP